MNREQNIARFEAELGKVKRDGMDSLLDYIRKSDFYTAPASTKYHLSTEGGLLIFNTITREWDYCVAGRIVATISDESLTIMALLHDICKTYFYTKGFRWHKDDKNKWQQAPTFNVDDKMPLGHGSKSAMIIKEYIHLDTAEMYAIWWHMGPEDNPLQFYQAVEKFPIIWAVHTADVMASHFMEDTGGNRELFAEAAAPAGEYADAPTVEDADAPPDFQEAPPLAPGA